MGKKVIYKGGETVTQIRYSPDGSHQFQRAVTDLLHRIVTEAGKFTLGECGYLHMNTLMFNRETQSIELKIYFDKRLATKTIQSNINLQTGVYPYAEFSIFENWLFVGPLLDVVSFEKILGPKTEIERNERGMRTLKIVNPNKMVETAAMVINCSLPLVIAAAHGISLTDPNFHVKCEAVSKVSKDAIKQIVVTASNNTLPVALDVEYSSEYDEYEYDPADAVPYLVQLADRTKSTEKKWKSVASDIRSKAETNKAKAERKNKSNKGFNKYV